MLVYNLIGHSDNYVKPSEGLFQYYRDDPNFNLKKWESFKLKARITERSRAAGNRKYVKIVVSLEYLNNFWRTLDTPLINCQIDLVLT